MAKRFEEKMPGLRHIPHVAQCFVWRSAEKSLAERGEKSGGVRRKTCRSAEKIRLSQRVDIHRTRSFGRTNTSVSENERVRFSKTQTKVGIRVPDFEDFFRRYWEDSRGSAEAGDFVERVHVQQFDFPSVDGYDVLGGEG